MAFDILFGLFNKVLNFAILIEHILIHKLEFNKALIVRALDNLYNMRIDYKAYIDVSIDVEQLGYLFCVNILLKCYKNYVFFHSLFIVYLS